MKTVKRLVCMVLALMIPFVCVLAEGASSVDAKKKAHPTPKIRKVTRVTLDQKNLTLYIVDGVKQSAKLSAIVYPEDATNSKVKWTISDNKIAKISQDGTVTARKEGTCVVTATAKDGSGKSSTCKVKVKKVVTVTPTPKPTSTPKVTPEPTLTPKPTLQPTAVPSNGKITIDQSNLYLVMESGTVEVNYTVSNVYSAIPIKVSMDDATIVSVAVDTKTKKLLITPVSKGTCTLGVYLEDFPDEKVTCKVTVGEKVGAETSDDIKVVTLAETTVNMKNGDTHILRFKVPTAQAGLPVMVSVDDEDRVMDAQLDASGRTIVIKLTRKIEAWEQTHYGRIMVWVKGHEGEGEVAKCRIIINP